jgi:hypothetical protein
MGVPIRRSEFPSADRNSYPPIGVPIRRSEFPSADRNSYPPIGVPIRRSGFPFGFRSSTLGNRFSRPAVFLHEFAEIQEIRQQRGVIWLVGYARHVIGIPPIHESWLIFTAGKNHGVVGTLRLSHDLYIFGKVTSARDPGILQFALNYFPK